MDALIEICESWKRDLEENGCDYYLKIWIFKKDFMSSQVVVSINEMIDFYSNTYEDVTSIDCLDETLFTDKSRSVSWKKGIHTIYYTDKELKEYLEEGIMSLREIEQIKAESMRKEIIHNDSAYIIKDDDVYIGTII